MSQYHSMDTSIDHSMMFDGDISILPSDIDQIHDQNTPTSTQIEEKENTPFRDVSADLVFSRSISSSNRKFRLPKTYTNVNKLNKLLFKDHKLLIKPIVTSSDQIVEIIKDKCKIWKVINDKNINDRIMSLDVPFITNALVKEYQKNVFFEKQTALTTLKKTRGKNLTQFEYNLLMHNILTSENLLLHNFTTPKNRNVKLQSLQTTYKRFFDPKTKRIVVVHQKTFKEVIPPFLLMETILHIHLINNHMKLETLYRNLVQKFCNTTRQSVVSALQSCSICRRDDVDDSEPEETLPTASEERSSMETVQVDVYELSDHKQVLVLKDLHSQYVWIEELDATIEDKAMRISNAVKKWTLSTAIATPITFSSISMDCDELHNIISLNTDIIDEKMGVVYANIGEYKHMREKATEEFANKNIDQCFEHIYRYNVTYNNHSKGLPKKLLYGTAFDFNVFEELRRKKVDKYTAWDNVFIEQ